MHLLYAEAYEKLQEEGFLRNHDRLLQRYYLSLRSRATDREQSVAIDFLRSRFHRNLISRKIFDMWREGIQGTLPGVSGESSNPRSSPKFGDVQSGNVVTDLETFSDTEEGSEHGGCEDGEKEKYNGPTLVDIDNARTYFVSGTPLMRFETEFRNLLYLSCVSVEELQKESLNQAKEKEEREVNRKPHRWHYDNVYWTQRLSFWLHDTFLPPKSGYKRVRYTCVSSLLS